MAASVDTFIEAQHIETESRVSPFGDAKAIIPAFAVFIAIALAWIGFFFGIVQPWIDSAYL